MLTLKQIREQVKKLKLEITPHGDDRCYELSTPYRDDELYGPEAIGFNCLESVFCCAVEEFGEFRMSRSLNKHWDLLLQFYLRYAKQHFFKCEVPEKEDYKPLSEALEKVGFEKRAVEQSNMGNYKVAIWEYIKK